MEKQFIQVEIRVEAPVREVWEYWTNPTHIMQWNNASADWYTPLAKNDVREGGIFSYRMAARDGGDSFYFQGTYNQVKEYERMSYTIDDGREVHVRFENEGNTTHIIEELEPDNNHPGNLQRNGWQGILNNFKKYVEG